ncbi:DUF3499 family protein, partial [Curtobacterium sp. PsM8]|uniref:DUF3499 family protein n=1 Tax=Curtobacterium sp. PsM8 TaxID=3030532 RepID=UPI00263B4E8D
MAVRICSKVACGAGASATLPYDYADSMVVVGPLSGRGAPPGVARGARPAAPRRG